MLGLFTFAVANARAEFPTTVRLSPTLVTIPDNEFGTEQQTQGSLVLDGQIELGVIWQAGCWCWRSVDGQQYGTADTQDAAIRQLWGAGR